MRTVWNDNMVGFSESHKKAVYNDAVIALIRYVCEGYDEHGKGNGDRGGTTCFYGGVPAGMGRGDGRRRAD